MANELALELVHAFDKKAYNKKYYQQNKQYWQDYYGTGGKRNRVVSNKQNSIADANEHHKQTVSNRNAYYDKKELDEAVEQARRNYPNASNEELQMEARRSISADRQEHPEASAIAEKYDLPVQAVRKYYDKAVRAARNNDPTASEEEVRQFAINQVGIHVRDEYGAVENKAKKAEASSQKMQKDNRNQSISNGMADRMRQAAKSKEKVAKDNRNQSISNSTADRMRQAAKSKEKVAKDNRNQSISNSMADRMKRASQNKIAKRVLQSSVSNSMADRMRKAALSKK